MSMEEDGPLQHLRLQSVLEYLTILGAAMAGMAHAPPWMAVPLAAVVLLWVSGGIFGFWLAKWDVPIVAGMCLVAVGLLYGSIRTPGWGLPA